MSRSTILTNAGDKCKCFFYKNSFFFHQSAGAFFNQAPGRHNLMAAAHAFEPEIRAHTQDLPLAAPAGMGLFQLYYVSDLIIQLFCHFFRLSCQDSVDGIQFFLGKHRAL